MKREMSQQLYDGIHCWQWTKPRYHQFVFDLLTREMLAYRDGDDRGEENQRRMYALGAALEALGSIESELSEEDVNDGE